ncbi:MAG: hypothetical protein ISS82_01655 [Nanoarchaeota archaeon]|nr:hypothetical protein [Nanoarchaeota archaeon]
MESFFNKKISHFIVLISFLILILLLDFIFFYPKFGETPEYENLRYVGYKNITETETLFFNNLKPGDIVAYRPVSFLESYSYILEKEESGLKNIFVFFFYYNLFDKVLANSMGEDGYWHVYIYMGNKTLNSLDFSGSSTEIMDHNFFKTKYLKILRVNTKQEYKKEAIKQAEIHKNIQDISYSLKNGLIVVFARSTGIIPSFRIEEDKLVCSSYIALLYKDITFNPYKNFNYISPADIEDSKLTETILLKNERGIYIK